MKDKIETVKIKVLDGSSNTMKIFSIGSPEEYLGHIMAVLSLIDRKGLREQLIKHVNKKKNAQMTLESLKQKSIGPKERSSKKDQNDTKTSDEIERKQTIEILKTAKEQYGEVIYWPANHLPSGIASSARCTKVTRGLVQMGKSRTGLVPRARLLFVTALSYISSQCSLPTPPKGSATTSNRESASPQGLVYASSSPGCNS